MVGLLQLFLAEMASKDTPFANHDIIGISFVKGYSIMAGVLLLCLTMMAEIAIKVGGGTVLRKFKSNKLRNIPNQLLVKVPERGHHVDMSSKEKNVLFSVLLTKTYPIAITVASIEYKISYIDEVIYTNTWSEGITLNRKENERRIYLGYYPRQTPTGLPLYADKWCVRGTVKIQCVFGETSKDFSSTGYLSSSFDGRWEDLRGN